MCRAAAGTGSTRLSISATTPATSTRCTRCILNDDGAPILVDVQMAWSQFKTPAVKQFKMIQAFMQTDGDPRPLIDFKVDYDYTPAQNQPDVTFAQAGAVWDEEPGTSITGPAAPARCGSGTASKGWAGSAPPG